MPSAQVIVKEVDLSTRVPSFPGVYGGIVIPAKKGPVGRPVLVTSDTQLLRVFTPDERIEVGYSSAYFSALAFLEKSNKCWVVRADNGSLYGGAVFKTSDSDYDNNSLTEGLEDPTAYLFDSGVDQPGVAQVSNWAPVADVSGSLAGKYFNYYEQATGDEHYVWFQVTMPAVAEQTEFTFSSAGSFYDVAGPAKYIVVFDGNDNAHYFWFNVTDGVETQVDPGFAGTAHQVDLLTGDTAAQVATKYYNAFASLIAVFTAANPTPGVVVVINVDEGDATDAMAFGSPAVVAVQIQGADEEDTGSDPMAGDVGHLVVIPENASPSAIKAAILGESIPGFSSGTGNTVTHTDPTPGEVEDGSSGDSGFTFQVITPGSNEVSELDEALLIYQANPGAWAHDKILVKITNYATNEVKVKEPGAFMIEVFKSSNLNIPVETFVCSRRLDARDGYGANIFVEDILEGSNFIRAFSNPAVDEEINPKDQLTPIALMGGEDGASVNDSHMITASLLLRNPDELFLTVLMDGGHATPAYGQQLDLIAEQRGDCVAVLSTPFADEASSNFLEDIVDYRTTELNLNSSRSALYTPHPLILDRFNNRRVYVAPDGYAAAAISFSASNYEIWYPPAGFKRGNIRVLDLRRKFDKGQMDFLYDNGINPIRFTPGRGINIWGQKTLLSRPSALDRLNVRLMLIVIEPAIAEALEDFLFDLNDEATRSLVTTLIDKYMAGIQGRRGVTAYAVVCDTTNNLPEDIDANRLNVDVYVQPTRSIEEIPLRIVITSTGFSFEEAAQLI